MSSIRHHVNSACPDCLVQLGTLPRTFNHVSVAAFLLSKVEHHWQVMQSDCLSWVRFGLPRCSSRRMSMISCFPRCCSQDPKVPPYRSGTLGWRQPHRKLAEIALNRLKSFNLRFWGWSLGSMKISEFALSIFWAKLTMLRRDDLESLSILIAWLSHT